MASAWRAHNLIFGCVCALLVAPSLLLSQGQGQGQGQTQTPVPPPATAAVFFESLSSRAPRRLADLPIPVPPDNPVSDAKIALGRQLFFDPVLSNDRTVSCGTCHLPDRAFTDTKALAVGVFGRVGRRHSPSLVNRGYGRSQFWDGRAATLEAQALMPIRDPNEMDLSLEDAVSRLQADAGYRNAFRAVFERPVSSEDLGRAIATYLRTIKSTDSPYDKFVDGDKGALTTEQQQGLLLFRTKGRCTICHLEPLFTDEAFQNTGVSWRVNPDPALSGAYADDGRFQVSGVERDRGKFKVPTLREIANTAPYMHDGSLATLNDVIDFYDRGGRSNPNLFQLVRPIGFTPADKQALIAFLGALSGTVSGK